ncbi:MAG: hypothetical protein RL204_729 [Bacteroidota bacterium]|jgi:ferredoxin
MFRITQQRIKCIGCNACVEAAPDRWAMSKKDGRCTLIGATEKGGFHSILVHDDEWERNEEAARNCPVKIIQMNRV